MSKSMCQAMLALVPSHAGKAPNFVTSVIRVIRKVRKTEHQNPEFGHTQGEIFFFKPAKKYISNWKGADMLPYVAKGHKEC